MSSYQGVARIHLQKKGRIARDHSVRLNTCDIHSLYYCHVYISEPTSAQHHNEPANKSEMIFLNPYSPVMHQGDKANLNKQLRPQITKLWTRDFAPSLWFRLTYASEHGE